MRRFKSPENKLEPVLAKGGVKTPQIPDNMYTGCPSCRVAVLASELEENLNVCPKCGYHFKISARQRIRLIADEGSFTEMDSRLHGGNLIQFPDYEAKLEKARQESGEIEAVITGTGKIQGMPVALFAMEGLFMMGSMGAAVGEKITRLFEYAAAHDLPVIGFTVSGGARMQEGIISLMQMAKTSGAVKMHSDKGLLYIVVLTNPTTGGVTASFAMQGDIIISEPGALICFAGPRVIQQTTRQQLPPGFQNAEFLLEKGFIDLIVPRAEQRKILSKLLVFHNSADKRGGGAL